MINARQMKPRLRNNGALWVPGGAVPPSRSHFAPRHSERGAVAVMFTVSLLVIFGLLGMSLDLARVYNRRVEMQNIADAIALAAARQLNGTPAGITNALNRASAAAARMKYGYNKSEVAWSDAAIRFSPSPVYAGTWQDAGAATANPQGLLYVRVDTNELSGDLGSVETLFMRILPSSPATVSTSGRAIAGPTAINVTPFAICAMSALPGEARANPASTTPTPAPANVELVQYGFRRGVSYDLMQLNPDAIMPVNFLVNPVAPPGSLGSPTDMTVAAVGPFICAGAMAMPRVTGGSIKVESPFPLANLFDRFNSRFDDYASGNCHPNAAPPDFNIRAYERTIPARIPWMNTAPGSQSAQSTIVGGEKRTIADPLPAPATNTAAAYGVLWSFARAVPFAAYTPGTQEPPTGYVPFGSGAWATLYNPGRPAASSYPAGTFATPYSASGGANFQAPSIANGPGLRNRRVLNVPLLECPVAGSNATVLGIGKFFMTVPATATTLHAEFGGVASEQSLVTKVELFP